MRTVQQDRTCPVRMHLSLTFNFHHNQVLLFGHMIVSIAPLTALIDQTEMEQGLLNAVVIHGVCHIIRGLFHLVR